MGVPRRSALGRLQRAVVGRLLRWPTARLLPRSLLLLEYRGRRTGQAHALPAQWAPDGDLLVVAVGHWRRKRWWRNLAPGPLPVRVHVAGRADPAVARLLLPDDPGYDGAVRAYRARFARAPLEPGVPLVVLRRGGP